MELSRKFTYNEVSYTGAPFYSFVNLCNLRSQKADLLGEPKVSLEERGEGPKEGKTEGTEGGGTRDTFICHPGPVLVWAGTASQLLSLGWSSSSKYTIPHKTNARVITAAHGTSSSSESLDKWKQELQPAWRISGGIGQCYWVNEWWPHKRGVRDWRHHWGLVTSHIPISITIWCYFILCLYFPCILERICVSSLSSLPLVMKVSDSELYFGAHSLHDWGYHHTAWVSSEKMALVCEQGWKDTHRITARGDNENYIYNLHPSFWPISFCYILFSCRHVSHSWESYSFSPLTPMQKFKFIISGKTVLRCPTLASLKSMPPKSIMDSLGSIFKRKIFWNWNSLIVSIISNWLGFDELIIRTKL